MRLHDAILKVDIFVCSVLRCVFSL